MADKRNPIRPILDLIRRQNTQLGAPKGLYGNVFDPVTDKVRTSSRGFYFTKVKARDILSMSEIYEQMKRQDVLFDFLPIDEEGIADVGSIADSLERDLLVLFSGVEVSRSVRFDIDINIKNAEILLYLNNTKIRHGEGSVKASPTLEPAKRHLLQIVVRRKKAQGTATKYFEGTIDVGQTVPFLLGPPAPDVPQWVSSGAIFYGTLDPNILNLGLILNWESSPYVGGWFVERTSYQGMGSIVSYVTSGVTGYDFVVSGAYAPQYGFAIEGDLIGFINGYSTDGDTTTINVISDATEDADWVGQNAYFEKETSLIAEVDRTYVAENDTVVYVDQSVIEGMPYTYELSAWSIFDDSLIGPLSSSKTSLAFDNTPPSPIVLWPDDLTATFVEDGNIVNVQHIYPPEPDLLGYRLYVESGSTYSLVSDLRRGSPFMLLDGLTVTSGDTPARYGIFKFAARRIQGFEVQHVVSGYVATTYDYAGNELPVESGTFIPFTLLVRPPENFTTFDHVISPTSKQRRPDSIPQVMWETAVNILERNIEVS